jgi:hypothetical protein
LKVRGGLSILEMVLKQSVGGIAVWQLWRLNRQEVERPAGTTARPGDIEMRRNEEMSMRSFGLILALVSATGSLVMAAPNAFAQASGYSANLLSASESTRYQLAEEAVPVRAALNQFDSALAMHDVEKLQAAGIKQVSAKGWERFFKNNPRATVTDHCPVSQLFISDDTASWTCTETATVISEGRPRSFVNVIRFTFARRNGTWMIADRR